MLCSSEDCGTCNLRLVYSADAVAKDCRLQRLDGSPLICVIDSERKRNIDVTLFHGVRLPKQYIAAKALPSSTVTEAGVMHCLMCDLTSTQVQRRAPTEHNLRCRRNRVRGYTKPHQATSASAPEGALRHMLPIAQPYGVSGGFVAWHIVPCGGVQLRRSSPDGDRSTSGGAMGQTMTRQLASSCTSSSRSMPLCLSSRQHRYKETTWKTYEWYCALGVCS